MITIDPRSKSNRQATIFTIPGVLQLQLQWQLCFPWSLPMP